MQREDPRFIEGAVLDVQVIARLLDPGDVPVTTAVMLAALAGDPAGDVPEDRDELERRLLNAMRYLQRRALVRWIMVGGQATSGWVWDHYPFTDAQWKARANAVHVVGTFPLPIIRFKAPEGRVVVVGKRTREPDVS